MRTLRLLTLFALLATFGWWSLVVWGHIDGLNSAIIGLLILLMAFTGWAQWASECNETQRRHQIAMENHISAGAPERPPDGCN